LRYNRPLEELSRAQQQAILQDEAIQLIGVNISSSFIDPYLSPFENKMRKLLHVDFFNITPGFIQNFVNEYVLGSTVNSTNPTDTNLQPYGQPQNDVGFFSSALLLNNLSVEVGKYVFRSLFLDYILLFQESTNLAKQTQLLIHHDISAQVNLPYRFRLTYSFKIQPPDKNAHEIMLQRSFRF
jgi:hypothetical protein